MGFQGEEYKALPKWLRDKLKASAEGKAHAAKGLPFNDPKEGEQKASTAPAVPGGGAPATRKLEMLPTATASYEAFKQGGWTDEQLVEKGYAKWSDPVPVPTPQAPVAPQAPAAPSAPPTPAAPPQAPAGPPPLMHEGRVIVPKVPGTDLHSYIAGGWTTAQLLEYQHAVFQ